MLLASMASGCCLPGRPPHDSQYNEALDSVNVCVNDLSTKISALAAAHVLDIENLCTENTQLKEQQTALMAKWYLCVGGHAPLETFTNIDDEFSSIPPEEYNKTIPYNGDVRAVPLTLETPLKRAPEIRPESAGSADAPINADGQRASGKCTTRRRHDASLVSDARPSACSHESACTAQNSVRSLQSSESFRSRREGTTCSTPEIELRSSLKSKSRGSKGFAVVGSAASVRSCRIPTTYSESAYSFAEAFSGIVPVTETSSGSFERSLPPPIQEQDDDSNADLNSLPPRCSEEMLVTTKSSQEIALEQRMKKGSTTKLVCFEVCELLREFAHERCDASGVVLNNGETPWMSSPTAEFDERGAHKRKKPRCRPIHPTSPKRLVWEIAGIMMLFFDILMIPMQVFAIPRNLFLQTMAWITLYYWTGDIFLSCYTGYYTPEGEVVKQFIPIVCRYARQWFLLDLLIVGIDWFPVVINAATGQGFSPQADQVENSQGSNLEIVRIAKVMRMLRLIRLLRIMKLTQSNFSFMLQERMESVRMYVISNLLKNILLIIMVNHFCACAWYGLGTIEVPGHTNWVKQYDMDSRTWLFTYLACFHWSMAQFANGEILIAPQNNPEQIMSICVSLASMVVFSSFLAIVGNTVHQLIQQKAAQRTDHWLLRLYLRENNTSLELRMRVNRYVILKLSAENSKLKHSDVKLFDMLSRPLQVELYTELYLGTLTTHEFFSLLSRVSLSIVRSFCTHAVRRVPLSFGDTLFSFGEDTACMYFMETGAMHYSSNGNDRTVKSGDFFCEAALWAVRWLTLGRMSATTECEMLALDRSSIRDVFMRYHTTNMKLPREYALAFVNALNEAHAQGMLSDLHSDVIRSESVQTVLRFFDRSMKRMEKHAQTFPLRFTTATSGKSRGT